MNFLSYLLAEESKVSGTTLAATPAEGHGSTTACLLCAAGPWAGHLSGVPTELLAQGEWRGVLCVRPANLDDVVKLLRLSVQCRL